MRTVNAADSCLRYKYSHIGYDLGRNSLRLHRTCARKIKLKGVTCSEILDEFSEKLTNKFNASPSRTAEIVAELLNFHQVVKIENQLKNVTPDPDDDKIIECAVVGGATHVVTGDKKHLLPLGNYQGILIVKAADMLAQFQ